jgi:hypothetical protein
VCTHAASVSRRRPSFMAQFALATFTFFSALGCTLADRCTRPNGPQTKITLDDTGVNFSSLPHIAIKSRPTEEKYANSMHPVPRACGSSNSHMGLWGRVRRGGLAGAAAAHPAVVAATLVAALHSAVSHATRRARPFRWHRLHTLTLSLGPLPLCPVHERWQPRPAASKCRARPLARPSSRLNNSKARSGHAHVCVR